MQWAPAYAVVGNPCTTASRLREASARSRRSSHRGDPRANEGGRRDHAVAMRRRAGRRVRLTRRLSGTVRLLLAVHSDLAPEIVNRHGIVGASIVAGNDVEIVQPEPVLRAGASSQAKQHGALTVRNVLDRSHPQPLPLRNQVIEPQAGVHVGFIVLSADSRPNRHRFAG